ncbi:MAG: cupin domain-containing protein [Desulfuromonadales bacterium]|nr:cupin domain-containing protein [Desulfuromonadales bacterium]
MKTGNIFELMPENLDEEAFDLIVQNGQFKIERIVSKGHSSPASGWYNQKQNEWVLVLKGEAVLSIQGGAEVNLGPGSHINIPAHTKHRVKWTHPELETVWLAIHY